jgi:hypothetical protein
MIFSFPVLLLTLGVFLLFAIQVQWVFFGVIVLCSAFSCVFVHRGSVVVPVGYFTTTQLHSQSSGYSATLAAY